MAECRLAHRYQSELTARTCLEAVACLYIRHSEVHSGFSGGTVSDWATPLSPPVALAGIVQKHSPSSSQEGDALSDADSLCMFLALVSWSGRPLGATAGLLDEGSRLTLSAVCFVGVEAKRMDSDVIAKHIPCEYLQTIEQVI